MKERFIAIAVSVLLGVGLSLGSALATEHDEAKSEPPTQHFLKEAAQGGMAEVALGKIAVQKAASEEVKQFGQRMVDDHGKANEELQQLAASKGVKLSEDMGAEKEALRERLSKLSGAEFDRAYMEEMVKDHQKDVAEFSQQAKHGEDPEIKNWAANTLPTLEEHLQQAQSTAKKVGVKITTEQSAHHHE
jgi:putative membrane protein